jgi:hypothetical protein
MGNDGETTSNERSKSKGRGASEVHLRPQHSRQAAASAHPQAGSDRTPPHLREGLNCNNNSRLGWVTARRRGERVRVGSSPPHRLCECVCRSGLKLGVRGGKKDKPHLI